MMHTMNKLIDCKKYKFFIIILNIFLLHAHALLAMKIKPNNKKYLSVKCKPSEKFLANSSDQINHFASLSIELIAFITQFLLKNPLYDAYPTRKVLIDALQNVTSFALIDNYMLQIFLDTQSDFASYTQRCLFENIIKGRVVPYKMFYPKKALFRNRARLVVPFLKHIYTDLQEQYQENYKWRKLLEWNSPKALKTLTRYQEVGCAPQMYPVSVLYLDIKERSLFKVFYRGIKQNKIHHNSNIEVKPFSGHSIKRPHYCTMLSFALDMVKNNQFNRKKSLKLITTLLNQGADPHHMCVRKSCKSLTPWQEAEAIKGEHPEVLALFQTHFLTKSE